jgi:hypothetical protein
MIGALKGVVSGESSALTFASVPMMTAFIDVVSLFGGIIVDFLFRGVWHGLFG